MKFLKENKVIECALINFKVCLHKTEYSLKFVICRHGMRTKFNVLKMLFRAAFDLYSSRLINRLIFTERYVYLLR